MMDGVFPSSSTAGASVAIEARGLKKTFRDFWRRPRVRAVDGISFVVPRGAIYGLLGPNGSGKSTTLKMILGLLFPSAGELLVLGGRPTDSAVRRRIGYLPEETRLYPALTPKEILGFHARLLGLSGAESRERAERLLESLDIAHAAGRPVGSFSKGMARRVGLAVALLGDPDLLILDEPTSGLDPQATRQVKDLMLGLAGRGQTILTTSHLLADVQDTCQRVAILHRGHLLAEGPLDRLLSRTAETTMTFPTPRDSSLLDKLRTGAAATLDVAEADLRFSHPRDTLEDYFLSIVGPSGKQSRTDGRGA